MSNIKRKEITVSAPGLEQNESIITSATDTSVAVRALYLVGGVAIIMLVFDFVLHALGAHDTGFASIIYSVGATLAAPFVGIFNTSLTTAGTIFVWADLLAMAVYGLVILGLSKIVNIVTERGN